MKTIIITAAEEKIILNALASRKEQATRKAKYMGNTATLTEKLLNIAIDASMLADKIRSSKRRSTAAAIAAARPYKLR